MQASSSVLGLIAALSAGCLFCVVVSISHMLSLKKKKNSDLSKSTTKHLYLFILTEIFLQIKGGGGWYAESEVRQT